MQKVQVHMPIQIFFFFWKCSTYFSLFFISFVGLYHLQKKNISDRFALKSEHTQAKIQNKHSKT